MKRKLSLIMLGFVSLLLAGCYSPYEDDFKTSSEICSYMNRNFKGEFTVLSEEFKDTHPEYGRFVTLNCNLNGKNYKVQTNESAHFIEWWTHPELKTNYFPVVYEREINSKIQDYIEEETGWTIDEVTVKLINAQDFLFSETFNKDFEKFWAEKKGSLYFYWIVNEELPEDYRKLSKKELLKYKSFQALDYINHEESDSYLRFGTVIQADPEIYDKVRMARTRKDLNQLEEVYKGKITYIIQFPEEYL